jgi:hypothetical protein
MQGWIYLDEDRDQWRIFYILDYRWEVIKCRVGFMWTRIEISGGFFKYLSSDGRVLNTGLHLSGQG